MSYPLKDFSIIIKKKKLDMKTLKPFQLDFSKCLAELEEYKNLLLQEELTEQDDILPFFKKREHLSAFIASYVPGISRFDRLKHEFTLFGDFRADLVVGDSSSHNYCFIEFEDGKGDSVFSKTERSNSMWSTRFERGFSQIIDWFWKIDDMKNTSQSRSVFGSENIEFFGMLIIGREHFLSPLEKERLRWRLNKVVIDSRKIICITFDQLAIDIDDRLAFYPLVFDSEIVTN